MDQTLWRHFRAMAGGLLKRVVLAITSLAATVALSATMDQFGLAPERAGQGQTGSQPAFAAATNPGDLSQSGSHYGLGLMQVGWHLNSLNAATPAESESSSPLPRDGYRQDQVEPYTAMSFGYHQSLPWRMGVGVAGLVPQGFIEIHGDSGRETDYLGYDLRRKRPEVALALGMNPFAGLTLGIGTFATVAMDANMQAGFSNQESAGRVHISSQPIQAPLYSIGYRMGTEGSPEGWYGGVYFSRRTALVSEAHVRTELVAQSDTFSLPTDIATDLTAFFDPEIRELSLEFGKDRWQVSSSYLLYKWSAFSPSIIRLSGPDIATLTEGQQTSAFPKLSDAWAIRFGGAYRVGIRVPVTLRAGYEFKKRVAISNRKDYLVDTDRKTYSTGMGVPLLPSLLPGLNFDFSVQHAFLVSQNIEDSDQQKREAGGTIDVYMGGLSRAF